MGVISGKLPLLMAQRVLVSRQCTLCFGANTLNMQNKVIKLWQSKTGHVMLKLENRQGKTTLSVNNNSGVIETTSRKVGGAMPYKQAGYPDGDSFVTRCIDRCECGRARTTVHRQIVKNGAPMRCGEVGGMEMGYPIDGTGPVRPYLIMADDCCRYIVIVRMSSYKLEPSVYLLYKMWCQQLGRPIKLWADRGPVAIGACWDDVCGMLSGERATGWYAVYRNLVINSWGGNVQETHTILDGNASEIDDEHNALIEHDIDRNYIKGCILIPDSRRVSVKGVLKSTKPGRRGFVLADLWDTVKRCAFSTEEAEKFILRASRLIRDLENRLATNWYRDILGKCPRIAKSIRREMLMVLFTYVGYASLNGDKSTRPTFLKLPASYHGRPMAIALGDIRVNRAISDCHLTMRNLSDVRYRISFLGRKLTQPTKRWEAV